MSRLASYRHVVAQSSKRQPGITNNDGYIADDEGNLSDSEGCGSNDCLRLEDGSLFTGSKDIKNGARLFPEFGVSASLTSEATLGAIKNKAMDIFWVYYREIICPQHEYENQEGLGRLVAENVENALGGQNFLWESKEHNARHFTLIPCFCSHNFITPRAYLTILQSRHWQLIFSMAGIAALQPPFRRSFLMPFLKVPWHW